MWSEFRLVEVGESLAELHWTSVEEEHVESKIRLEDLGMGLVSIRIGLPPGVLDCF